MTLRSRLARLEQNARPQAPASARQSADGERTDRVFGAIVEVVNGRPVPLDLEADERLEAEAFLSEALGPAQAILAACGCE